MEAAEKTYRNMVSGEDLLFYEVNVRETELLIRSDVLLRDEALAAVHSFRGHIEAYIDRHPDFLTSLAPLPEDDFSPAIVRAMLGAGKEAGVGPMAAVAGAIAEFVGRKLEGLCRDVIIENGGDIFLKSRRERRVGIFAGDSPLSERIALKIPPAGKAIGICTSSGTVGHSLSFGKADAVCVLSGSATLSDAAATAVGNVVKRRADIVRGIERARQIPGVQGILIIVGDQMGLWGEMEIVRS
ncbi:MAG TPA: UPF0280 family protein [Syntrophales bacterium]|nr:UPF0280 family protein [Syntrophales bacterium]